MVLVPVFFQVSGYIILVVQSFHIPVAFREGFKRYLGYFINFLILL